MEINESHIETGHPKNLNLNVKVSCLTRTSIYSSFKIGITCDPYKRRDAYVLHSTRFTEMVLIYQTDSISYAKLVENELTSYHDHIDENDNKIKGGGGNYGLPPYYVYVVRQKI